MASWSRWNWPTFSYKKGTYEDYVGERSLEKRGKKKWRGHVADVVDRLIAALEPDDVVLGGGNVKKLKELPRVAARATTPMPSWAGFASGRKRTSAGLQFPQRLAPSSPQRNKRSHEMTQTNRAAH